MKTAQIKEVYSLRQGGTRTYSISRCAMTSRKRPAEGKLLRGAGSTHQRDCGRIAPHFPKPARLSRSKAVLLAVVSSVVALRGLEEFVAAVAGYVLYFAAEGLQFGAGHRLEAAGDLEGAV